MDTTKILQEQQALSIEIKSLIKQLDKKLTRETFKEIDINLNTVWKKFNQNHEILIENLDENDVYFSEENFENTEILYDTAIKKLKETKISDTKNKPNSKPIQNNDLQSFKTESQINRDQPKLPPIHIPQFNGNVKEFQRFVELFRAVIDQNNRISDVEKFQYLLGYLEGDAKKLISHLAFSGKSYSNALELLQNRYDNPRLIIESYTNMILKSKAIRVNTPEDMISLHDEIREALAGLTSYGYPLDDSNPLLSMIIMSKFDQSLIRRFEESNDYPMRMPKCTELLDFLQKRARVETSLRSRGNDYPTQNNNSFRNKTKSYHTSSTTNSINSSTKAKPSFKAKPKSYSYDNPKSKTCSLCSGSHILMHCPRFLALSIQNRRNHVYSHDICFNCLSHSRKADCISRYSCFTCNKRHHTLLHLGDKTQDNNAAQQNKNTYQQRNDHSDQHVSNNSSLNHHADAHENSKSGLPESQVHYIKTPVKLLPTAIVNVQKQDGSWQQLRALVDSGSCETFITESAIQKLKLPRFKDRTLIKGIGTTDAGLCRGRTNLLITPRFSSKFKLPISALILTKLTSSLPITNIRGLPTNKLRNILIADPTFDTPGPVDLLLGTDAYSAIILDGIIKLGTLIAQNTEFGYIAFGNAGCQQSTNTTSTSLIAIGDIDNQLRKFWEMDAEQDVRSAENDECEVLYRATHRRNEDGRYTVSLPFKQTSLVLGNSKKQAIARFFNMERKFKSNPELKKQYHNFMKEYKDLNHMTLVPPYNGPDKDVFYLPHHAVFKEESTTTKIRVVFDGSCRSTTGVSLNALLAAGPKVQQDLSDILTRWRKHQFVFTADIEKMFRQVLIGPEHRDYQRILWRDHPGDDLQEYQLNTITYGTASATYLSVRTILQLAMDEETNHPVASKIIKRDFYVDDLLTGADSVEEAEQMHEKLIKLLACGGFRLRKWTSNNQGLLNKIDDNHKEGGIYEITEKDTVSALGVQWNPAIDSFQYKLKLKYDKVSTKRQLLADVASLFDPLGWIAPITLRAKLLIQEVWRSNLNWDQSLSTDIQEKWNKFVGELPNIQKIRIPRYLNHKNGQKIQLHGFCDASEKAFSAVVYSRTFKEDGTPEITLIAAKTKVAPLKSRITLPRLELCGAVLLSKLIFKIKSALEINDIEMHLWSDSEITIAWLLKDPAEWDTYVGNRVAEVHKLTNRQKWYHVPSESNPADIASRGCCPSVLPQFELWWKGPNWLLENPIHWPSYDLLVYRAIREAPRTPTVEELEIFDNEATALAVLSQMEPINRVPPEVSPMFKKYDSFRKLILVMSLCKRFIYNCREKNFKKGGRITRTELQATKEFILRILQKQYYSEEIKSLKRGHMLTARNRLIALDPFIENDILKVGGRLQNSELPSTAIHPIILPTHDEITKAIILDAHRMTLHGGTSLTYAQIRNEYWIVNGRNYVSSVIYNCVECTRERRETNNNIMGQLPAARVIPAPPFTNTGVDYAGPFTIKFSKGRGTKTTKGYVSVFICMATKAVHLELVGDLSSEAFIAAFKRFTSRRGKCHTIYSDNGTNFVGANKILSKELKTAIKRATQTAADLTLLDGIEWKFNPPSAPHFGGLWEAAVKSMKKHLRKTIGETALSFEEFTTVLTMVEACLNSRPIAPMSNDPNDLMALTPGHFLIGKPMLALPEADHTSESLHYRWKAVTHFHQNLWKRWSSDYLTLLHRRNKWKLSKDINNQPEIGDLVLIKDEVSAPLKWPMARIEKLHPGKDGIVRVVTLKTQNGSKQRPLVKLCRLPKDSNSQSNTVQDPSTSNAIQQQSTSNAAQQPSTSRRRQRFTTSKIIQKSSTLLSIIVLSLCFALAFGQNLYTLVQTNKSSLYIENLGTASLKRGKLRIETSIGFQQIELAQNRINQVWESVDILCRDSRKLTQEISCVSLLAHLSHERIQISNHIAALSNCHKRSRRGILGQAFNLVFGTNDDIYHDIDDLNQDNQALHTMINRQTLKLNARIDADNQIIESRFQMFQDKINDALTDIRQMDLWPRHFHQISVKLQMLTAYTAAESFYKEVLELTGNIVKVIDHKGSIQDFVNASSINAAIRTAKENVASQLIIIRNPTADVHYNCSASGVTIYGYLNIMEPDQYELIHVTSIPQYISDDIFNFPIIDHSTIGVNFLHQQYFYVYKETCQFNQFHRNLCQPDIIYHSEQQHNCIVEQIYKQMPSKLCNFTQAHAIGTAWKKCAMSNTWVYVTDKPTVVSVFCKSSREEVILQHAGVIKTSDGCFIETPKLTLRETMKINTKVKSSLFVPLMPNITTEVLEGLPNITFSKPIMHSEPLFKGVDDVSLPRENMLHHITRHPAFTVSSAVTCTIVIVIIWRTRSLWKPLCSRCSKLKSDATSTSGNNQPASSTTVNLQLPAMQSIQPESPIYSSPFISQKRHERRTRDCQQFSSSV